MKPRTKRAAWIAAGVAALGVAVALVMNAFQSNLVFFFTPSDVAGHKAPRDRTFRIGGLVEEGSVKRNSDALTVAFRVTDTVETIPVTFTGILPDLFKEGKGVVAQGKHDENYMPPEAAEALQRAGRPMDKSSFAGQMEKHTGSTKP